MTRLWFLLPAAVASLGGIVMAQDAAPTFPTGAGQAEVQAACAACHPPAIVASKRYDADKWAEVVDQMIGKGGKVSDADYDVIVAYLARTYGVGK